MLLSVFIYSSQLLGKRDNMFLRNLWKIRINLYKLLIKGKDENKKMAKTKITQKYLSAKSNQSLYGTEHIVQR